MIKITLKDKTIYYARAIVFVRDESNRPCIVFRIRWARNSTRIPIEDIEILIGITKVK